MTDKRDADAAFAAKARFTAIVVAVTGLVWLIAQSLGPKLGLPVRYVFLFDFAALAAFFWALVVGFQLWRARQSEE